MKNIVGKGEKLLISVFSYEVKGHTKRKIPNQSFHTPAPPHTCIRSCKNPEEATVENVSGKREMLDCQLFLLLPQWFLHY